MKVYKYFKERIGDIWAPALKIMANGMPLKCDTYQSCTNMCRYCTAEIVRKSGYGRIGINPNMRIARILDIKSFANFLEDAQTRKPEESKTPFMDWALRNKYYIELGTTGETFQEADKELRVSYNFFKIAGQYKIPLMINTKFNLIAYDDEYKRMIAEYPAPIIFCMSLSTVDDKIGKYIDPMAPLPSKRLEAAKEFSKMDHVKTTVYLAPFIPGISDANYDDFVGKMVDAGIIGAHIRDFFIQGEKMKKSNFWQKYIHENRLALEPFPGGYHVRKEKLVEAYKDLQRVADSKTSNFSLVGLKGSWFELNPIHGRCDMDKLPEKFQKGIVDWTGIPLLRKIRQNMDKPQLLLWDKMGYKVDKISLPRYVCSNEGGINNLMVGKFNCNTCTLNTKLDGPTWIIRALWHGMDDSKPSGWMHGIDSIYPIKTKDGFLKDDNGVYAYAYIPAEQQLHYVKNDQNVKGFVKAKEIGESYVDESVVKDFMVTERAGGIEDKFLC